MFLGGCFVSGDDRKVNSASPFALRSDLAIQHSPRKMRYNAFCLAFRLKNCDVLRVQKSSLQFCSFVLSWRLTFFKSYYSLPNEPTTMRAPNSLFLSLYFYFWASLILEYRPLFIWLFFEKKVNTLKARSSQIQFDDKGTQIYLSSTSVM